MQFSAAAQITDNIQAGASFTGTLDATTKEHLQNAGYVGIKIGDYVFGWDNIQNGNGDIKISFNLEAYFAVGAGANVDINVSEIWRRYFN